MPSKDAKETYELWKNESWLTAGMKGTKTKIVKHIPLQPADIILKTNSREVISPAGVIKVNVKLNNKSAELPLYTARGRNPTVWTRVLQVNKLELARDKKSAQRVLLYSLQMDEVS